MQKERFKIFVRNHPALASHVYNKKMTWQQFYELYDLYGEDNNIWNSFFDNNNNNNRNEDSKTVSNASNNIVGTIKDIMGLFKGIDVNTVQRTLGSIDKALEAIKGLGINDNNDSNRTNYEERPKYKYFED